MHGQCAISSHFQFIISANQPEKIHVEVFVQIVAAGVILNDSVVVVYRDSQSASRQTTQLEFPVIVAVIYDPNFRGPWTKVGFTYSRTELSFRNRIGTVPLIANVCSHGWL